MRTSPKTWHQGDVDPPWVVDLTVNGTALDYSEGYTFEVVVTNADDEVLLVKDTGIVGGVGRATCVWAPGELDLPVGEIGLQLRTLRDLTGDDVGPGTIIERGIIAPTA